MLSKRIIYGLYNEYVKSGARVLGAKNLTYSVTGRATCEDCYSFEGKKYNLGHFLPFIPRHPSCECWFEPAWNPDHVIPYLATPPIDISKAAKEAYVEVVGGDPAILKSIIEGVLKLIPKEHQALMTKISVRAPQDFKVVKWNGHQNLPAAIYEMQEDRTGKLTFNVQHIDDPDVYLYTIHEHGHAVYYQYIGPEAVAQWNWFYYKMPKEDLVSDYARWKADEGFPEEYTRNILGKDQPTYIKGTIEVLTGMKPSMTVEAYESALRDKLEEADEFLIGQLVERARRLSG